MLKLVIQTGSFVGEHSDEEFIEKYLEDRAENQYFVVTHANAQTHYANIFGQLSEKADSSVNDLIKLLIMHPCFRQSKNILDAIYTGMLELIGLDAYTVNRISRAFAHSDIMVVSIINSLQRSDMNKSALNFINHTGYFEIKLHSNCKSLIRKAKVNLIHLSATRWERQVQQ